MELRNDGPLHGLYCFPGGKEEPVDNGHLHLAARREIIEELNVDADAVLSSAKDFSSASFFVRTFIARHLVTDAERNERGDTLCWFGETVLRQLSRDGLLSPSSHTHG